MIIEKCYAKINLVLNVFEKLDNNYHEVDFIMTTVNIFDVVRICKSEVDELVCENLNIAMEDNLAYKAYKLMKKKYNLNSNIKIEIEKNIPVAAGMAGGSSDCAGVIRAINRLFNLDLSIEEMIDISKGLGSDVAFCVVQNTSRAQGHGEILTSIELPIKKQNLLVINPGFELSTKSVYDNYIVKKKNNYVTNMLKSMTYSDVLNNLHNDLEDAAIIANPKTTSLLDSLRSEEDVVVILSGSGPTVLAFSENNDVLVGLYNKYKKLYENVYFTEMR